MVETIDEETYNAWLAQQDSNKMFDAAVSLQYQLDDAHKQLEKAKEIIESLLEEEYVQCDEDWTAWCLWCRADKPDHESYCPRQAAVAFLEGK